LIGPMRGLAREAMERRPIVVVVTGSECTGKTTLAEMLAADLDSPRSGEYAREYLEVKAQPLDETDVEPIARGQIRAEDAAAARATRIVVKDTDLVSTVVYSRHYYGGCPAWIEQVARERRGDLYLLLHPDVPWVADGLFRDRPELREHIHGLFARKLEDLGAPVANIRGPWNERYARALAEAERLLGASARFRRR
jgi:NadR type nicotinamide-nucleotide adenylyltransferase